MVLTLALTLFSILAGCLLVNKVMGESSLLLCLSHGILTASLLLIGIGNWVSKPVLLGLLIGLTLLGLLLKGPRPAWQRLKRWQGVVLGGATLLVLLYTLYHQFRFLDTDNWLHEPIIGSLMKGVFPPMHPFTPGLELHYHYGRDFLIAMLTPPLYDPLATVWWINPTLQVAGFLALFSSVRALTGSTNQGLLAALMAYFGLCVGARVGLINTFDAYNGMASCQLFLLFHILLRMLENKRPAQWVLAAFLLGSYQLVYETFWALLFIAGLFTAIRFVRDRWGWAALVVTAVLALALAAVEGGIFSNMVSRSNKVETSEAEALRSMHVAASFPKEQFLKIPVTTAPYQRISAAYKSGLFRSWKPERLEEGHLFIFGPQFLYAFWLPVFLAPLTGWALRKDRVGFTFWIFGATSYLLPGIVSFGERYDEEYFRWEFSAAIGFAVAFGMALARWLEDNHAPPRLEKTDGEISLHIQRGKTFAKWLLCWALLVGSLAPAQKFLNDAVIDVQRDGLPPLDPTEWRVAHPDLGVEQADMEAMRWLAQRLQPGQQTLSNLGSETALGIWPDIVLSARTGSHLAGRMRPEAGLKSYAYPTYHRDGAAKAFALTGDVGFLQATDIAWYYADLGRLNEAAQTGLEALDVKSPVFEVEGHRRQVFGIPPVPEKVLEGLLKAELDFQTGEPLRTTQAYSASVSLTNQGTERGPALLECVFHKTDGEGQETADIDSRYRWLTPILEAGQTREVPFALVTPFENGEYRFTLRQGDRELLSRPVVVDYWTRLSSIQARLDLPDNFQATRFERFRVGLTSQVAIQSEVVLTTRLKRQDGGEYVWEVDQIPQRVQLDLSPGEEQLVFLDLLAPAGEYTLELYLQAPGTPLKQKLAERGVSVRPVNSEN